MVSTQLCKCPVIATLYQPKCKRVDTTLKLKTNSLRSLVKDETLKDKIRIYARPCNILYIVYYVFKIEYHVQERLFLKISGMKNDTVILMCILMRN